MAGGLGSKAEFLVGQDGHDPQKPGLKPYKSGQKPGKSGQKPENRDSLGRNTPYGSPAMSDLQRTVTAEPSAMKAETGRAERASTKRSPYNASTSACR